MKKILSYFIHDKEKLKSMTQLQKFNNLFISMFCSYVSYYGSPWKFHQTVDVLLLVYFVVDIFMVVKLDMLVHHILTIILLFIDMRTNIIFFEKITRTILLCEVSTIFLSIYNLKGIFPQINKFDLGLKILFFVTYTYFRIYILTNLFIFNNEFENIGSLYFQSKYKRFGQYICYSLLNLYYFWYAVIIEKIVLSTMKKKL